MTEGKPICIRDSEGTSSRKSEPAQRNPADVDPLLVIFPIAQDGRPFVSALSTSKARPSCRPRVCELLSCNSFASGLAVTVSAARSTADITDFSDMVHPMYKHHAADGIDIDVFKNVIEAQEKARRNICNISSFERDERTRGALSSNDAATYRAMYQRALNLFNARSSKWLL